MDTPDDCAPAFLRLGPATPMRPVVLAVPHAGRDYPAALLAAARVRREALEALEDRHADRLVRDAAAAGFTVLVATRARAWIDLNRDPRELDPAMVAPTPPRAALVDSVKLRGGLGLVPRRLAGLEIYRRLLSADDVAARIGTVHAPWHAAIAAALAGARARFGSAALLDCHSMPPLARAGGAAPARIVIGDRFGTSAAPTLADAASHAALATGHRVARNLPYAGGHTLKRHGRPDAQLHALQLEVDRTLYLGPDLRSVSSGLAQTAALVTAIACAMEAALAAPHALAAE